MGMEDILQQALLVERNHATGWYMLGSCLERQKRYQEAILAREKSLMLDISRKRSLPEYADIVAKLCKEKNCSTANLHQQIRDEAEIKGVTLYDKLWGDHEHLTPEGCRL